MGHGCRRWGRSPSMLLRTRRGGGYSWGRWAWQPFRGGTHGRCCPAWPPVVGGLVELEVNSPHVVRPLGAPQLPGGEPATLAFTGRRTTQAFFAPQATGALLV